MIYLMSPYWHKDCSIRVYRANLAAKATAIWFKEGLHVYSPIAHSYLLVNSFPELDGEEYKEAWMRHAKEMLSFASEAYCLCLDGWEESNGIKEELDETSKLKLDVTAFIFDSEGGRTNLRCWDYF